MTLLVEVTEQALIARPEAMLRALNRLRAAGWGIALDDVGGDSRSLALMSILYPDVIKLDLRLLSERAPQDVARIVTAVGGEAARRHATVLAEGIDSDELLDTAKAYGAALGQGYQLGPPAPLPATLPAAGRALRLPGAGADPFGPTPWELVTNWRRPTRGRASWRWAPRACSSTRPRRSARPRWCSSRSPTTATATARSSATAGCRIASRSSAC